MCSSARILKRLFPKCFLLKRSGTLRVWCSRKKSKLWIWQRDPLECSTISNRAIWLRQALHVSESLSLLLLHNLKSYCGPSLMEVFILERPERCSAHQSTPPQMLRPIFGIINPLFECDLAAGLCRSPSKGPWPWREMPFPARLCSLTDSLDTVCFNCHCHSHTKPQTWWQALNLEAWLSDSEWEHCSRVHFRRETS